MKPTTKQTLLALQAVDDPAAVVSLVVSAVVYPEGDVPTAEIPDSGERILRLGGRELGDQLLRLLAAAVHRTS